MRTRTRLVVLGTASRGSISVPSTRYKCEGGVELSTTAWPAFNVNTHYVRERITDALGKASSHPVVHRRETVQASSLRPQYGVPAIASPWGQLWYTGLNDQWADTYVTHLGTYGSFDVSDDVSMPPGWTATMMSPDQEALLREDVREKAGQLKADMLLNLVEANQAWPSVMSLASSLPVMASNWKDIRKVVRTASDGYLAYKFGVSPIMSDIKSILRHLPKLGKDIRRHMQQKEYRFSTIAELRTDYDKPTRDSGPNNGVIWLKIRYRGQLIKAPVVRYVLIAKPNISYASGFLSKLDYAMSRFTTSPARLAWEKIPFSFVADWYVDIRGALRELDNILGFSPYEVVSFTRSFSYHTKTDVYHQYFSTCDSALMVDGFSGSVECEHYERSLVSKNDFVPIWRPRIGNNQAKISAALIGQMLAKLPKRYWY